MRSASVHILPLLLALPCLLAGCAHRGRVIPEEKLSRIYEEMFLADQWIRETPDARRHADTTLFFDPIFKRYGYTFEDFNRSIDYYLDRPDTYVKILNKASARLRQENERLQKLNDERTAAEREKDRLHALYKTDWDFADDSLSWARDRILWPVRPAPVDTPAAAADSVAATDSTARRDFLVPSGPLVLRDSLRRPFRRLNPDQPLERNIITQ